MHFIAAALTAATLTLATAAVAQTPAPTSAPTAPATPASRLSIDTPIEQVAADPAGKAVLDRVIPGLLTNDAYDQYKSMSLSAVAPYSNGRITDAMLAQATTELSAIE